MVHLPASCSLPRKRSLAPSANQASAPSCREGFDDARVDRLVLQDVAVLVDEDADRHAPGALAGENPVRPVGDHAAQPVLAGGRDEARVVDGPRGAGAQRVFAAGA